MLALLCFTLAVLVAPFKSKSQLEAENAALRHQLIVLRRKIRGRVRLTNNDRWFFIELYRWFPSILKVRDRDRVYGTMVTPIARHGHPGQAYCTSLALAEWLCRTTDRIDPARVRRSYLGLG
jgi:hypothetical protein